jgi:hypothetical protein
MAQYHSWVSFNKNSFSFFFLRFGSLKAKTGQWEGEGTGLASDEGPVVDVIIPVFLTCSLESSGVPKELP